MLVDYSNYKRFFAFGCSFTSHVYPTWANIIASEMPKAIFYNFGKTGGGNPLICSRIAEANLKFNFNSTDLVMVMFSTFYREDRYMNGSWISNGNIFNNCIYGEKFVKEFADPIGYLIRDFAYIELVKNYLNNLPCKSILLTATDYKEDLNDSRFFSIGDNANILRNILQTYTNLIESFPKSLKELVQDENKNWKTGHQYYWNNEIHLDPHPNPEMYYDYLKKLNFVFSEKSEKFVNESMEALKKFNDKSDFTKIFPELDRQQSVARNFLF